MHLSSIFILFILFIWIITNSDNARIRRNRRFNNQKLNMVAYCELTKLDKIKNEDKRECCEKIVHIIREKRKTTAEKEFFKHRMTNRQHIHHVATYFKTKRSLPSICRNLQYPKSKFAKNVSTQH
uniref:Uncharacterized protein n=1 Tax=Meloidogyne enterolobii TaxID=390850 RepID=A0A6V7V013_MELEN|nr:unnamed protein product [Meloidogyne enterolobii]